MQIDYDVLERAATSLCNAHEQVRWAPRLAHELGAGAPSPDTAYGDAVAKRSGYCVALGNTLLARGRAFRDTVEEFRCLDAQIAAQATS